MTGASGFVGGHVAATLAALGHTVLAYGRRDASALARPLPGYTAWDIAAGPLRDAPAVDAVVHCGARVGDWGSADAYHAANVEGTRHVLASFPHAARVVHVSTSSVYSDHVHKLGVREDAHTGDCRHSAYGRTKAQAEALVRATHPSAVILRPHIVYGPGDTTLLPRVLAARRLGRLPVPGDGRNRLSVTHVANLVHAVERALQLPGGGDSSGGGTFNVADGVDASADELLRVVLARVGVAPRLLHVPRALAWRAAALMEAAWPAAHGDATRGPPLTRYVVAQLADDHTLDITRARTLLGYAPRWTFRDGPMD